MTSELPILAFATQSALEQYYTRHYLDPSGIWLRFYKKNATVRSVSYDEALDTALCYGWIDGQVKRYDEISYLQKFTPRRPKSVWSKRNKEHVARLIKEGRMRESGLREVMAAKKDGRWEAAYDSPKNATIPDDFLQQLAKNKKAKAFFQTLNKANLYAIAWRLQTAKKPEIRQKRLKTIIAMLSEGKKFH